MNIGCIIQARNTSSRLPGKVMLPLPLDSNTSVLEHVISRVKKVDLINTIIVATTTNSDDDSIVQLSEQLNTVFFRGSEDNVLSRYYYAAKKNNLDVIIRITSDCPCIDYKILSELIKFHIEGGYAYSSNTFERTFPHGMDAEIFNYNVLEEAYNNANNKFEIEHVTPYIYKSNYDKFKIGSYKQEFDTDLSKIRITLDTPNDYLLLGAVFDYLKNKPFFLLEDIVNIYTEKPWLYCINDDIIQKKILLTKEEQFIEAKKILTKQELYKVVEWIDGVEHD